MSKCKYFGLSEKFSKSEILKGNWMNRKGIYFGCGNADDVDGVYCSVNGRESKISDSVTLQPGDIIGMRFDAEAGEVYFDLNNKDYGIRTDKRVMAKLRNTMGFADIMEHRFIGNTAHKALN